MCDHPAGIGSIRVSATVAVERPRVALVRSARIPPLNQGHAITRGLIRRRTFLVAGGLGFCRLRAPSFASGSTSPTAGRAKSTILVWLSGGVSHIDTWDLKPSAPAEFRGEFHPIATSASGIRFCEHLPKLARQAHHLAVINSLGHFGRGT